MFFLQSNQVIFQIFQFLRLIFFSYEVMAIILPLMPAFSACQSIGGVTSSLSLCSKYNLISLFNLSLIIVLFKMFEFNLHRVEWTLLYNVNIVSARVMCVFLTSQVYLSLHVHYPYFTHPSIESFVRVFASDFPFDEF